MRPSFSVDELRRYPHAPARLAHAAFQDIAHAQLSADLPDVDRLAFVGKARIAGDHE